MVIGGLPLVIISILNHENAVSGSLMNFTENDALALLYTSIFGSAVSYGVYFYSATKGVLKSFIMYNLSFHFIFKPCDSLLLIF